MTHFGLRIEPNHLHHNLILIAGAAVPRPGTPRVRAAGSWAAAGHGAATAGGGEASAVHTDGPGTNP